MTCPHDPAVRLCSYPSCECAVPVCFGLDLGITEQVVAVHGLWNDLRRADTERLEFVVKRCAWIDETKADSGVTVYQLMTQDEDECFVALSGIGLFFPTWRAAIDAAIKGSA